MYCVRLRKSQPGRPAACCVPVAWRGSGRARPRPSYSPSSAALNVFVKKSLGALGYIDHLKRYVWSVIGYFYVIVLNFLSLFSIFLPLNCSHFATCIFFTFARVRYFHEHVGVPGQVVVQGVFAGQTRLLLGPAVWERGFQRLHQFSKAWGPC